MLCFALLCFALLCFALLCFALLCFALLCFALLCFALLCFALLCCAVLCCAVLCCAVLCCTVLYCTVLYCSVLCIALCAVLCIELCTVLCTVPYSVLPYQTAPLKILLYIHLSDFPPNPLPFPPTVPPWLAPVEEQREGDEGGDDHLGPPQRAHVVSPQRVTHGHVALHREADDEPHAEEARHVAHVHERLTPAVHVEHEHAHVAEPHGEQLQEEAGVGDGQRGEVDGGGELAEVCEDEDDEGADVADKADEDDDGRDVEVQVPQEAAE